MIDFHVLSHPTQRRVCFEFVHPRCAVHRVPGVDRHIGRGRFEGFSRGTAPYVSFYDDDDTLELGVIDKILGRLDADPTVDAVCTNEYVLRNGSRRGAKKPIKDGNTLRLRDVAHVHHLVVVRRATILPFLPLLLRWPDWCEFSLWVSMVKAGCKFQWMSDFGYMWVIHDQNAKSLKIELNPESVALVKEIYRA